jgi:hypothetical protein
MNKYVTATADGTMVSGNGRIMSAHLDPGTDTTSVVIYDGSSSDGTAIMTLRAPQNGPGDSYHMSGLVYSQGLYAKFSAENSPMLTLEIG